MFTSFWSHRFWWVLQPVVSFKLQRTNKKDKGGLSVGGQGSQWGTGTSVSRVWDGGCRMVSGLSSLMWHGHDFLAHRGTWGSAHLLLPLLSASRGWNLRQGRHAALITQDHVIAMLSTAMSSASENTVFFLKKKAQWANPSSNQRNFQHCLLMVLFSKGKQL